MLLLNGVTLVLKTSQLWWWLLIAHLIGGIGGLVSIGSVIV